VVTRAPAPAEESSGGGPAGADAAVLAALGDLADRFGGFEQRLAALEPPAAQVQHPAAAGAEGAAQVGGPAVQGGGGELPPAGLAPGVAAAPKAVGGDDLVARLAAAEAEVEALRAGVSVPRRETIPFVTEPYIRPEVLRLRQGQGQVLPLQLLTDKQYVDLIDGYKALGEGPQGSTAVCGSTAVWVCVQPCDFV